MSPRSKIWNILHDGEIELIEGSVPGDIDLRVGIQYLRTMFSDDGEAIIVHLKKCTKFSMLVWENNQVINDLDQISKMASEILSTDSDDTPLQIVTTVGILDMDFDSFSLSLDNGETITFEQLSEACQKYWNRWDQESKQNKRRLRTLVTRDRSV